MELKLRQIATFHEGSQYKRINKLTELKKRND